MSIHGHTVCLKFQICRFNSFQMDLKSHLPRMALYIEMLLFTLCFFLGGKAAFVLHVLFSLLNTMYIPYAIVYYVQRVYLMCKHNGACSSANLDLTDYMTDEIVVMLVGIFLHIPFWYFVLMVVDIKKSGGKVSEAFKIFQVRIKQQRTKSGTMRNTCYF